MGPKGPNPNHDLTLTKGLPEGTLGPRAPRALGPRGNPLNLTLEDDQGTPGGTLGGARGPWGGPWGEAQGSLTGRNMPHTEARAPFCYVKQFHEEGSNAEICTTLRPEHKFPARSNCMNMAQMQKYAPH